MKEFFFVITMKKWESENQQFIAKIVNRKEVILYQFKKKY